MALDDSYYMKQALQEAQKAGERGEVPVGAVVVCKDRIIARAHNLTETLTDVTAHAEMQAITAAAASLGGKYLNNVLSMSQWNLRDVVPVPLPGRRWDVWSLVLKMRKEGISAMPRRHCIPKHKW